MPVVVALLLRLRVGLPLLRWLAFMLGLRAIRNDDIYRKQFEALVGRNGGKKLPAVLAVGSRMLKLMFSVARRSRAHDRDGVACCQLPNYSSSPGLLKQ